MCISAAGRVAQITIWHLPGAIRHAHKHERVQMRDMRSAIFPQRSWELDGKKNQADVMASNISHFWGGNGLQMEHIWS